MHRAFHAVPAYMTAPDGRPTNACFGFLSMLLKLADDFAPDAIVCAFDHGIPAFRLQAIEQYKAQRPPTDPDLKQQFPMIKEILFALDIPVVELDGWEGDDILGTLAAQGAAEGMRTLLVTGDKDALQLVTEQINVVNTRQGMTDVVVYDPPAVFEKWGVTPEQVPDFLGLMGDSSDNIPGVPGVGPKKAKALLQEYGTLEEVLAHASAISGKLGESIRSNADLARASRNVATIHCDVPLECDLASVHFPSYDASTVQAAFRVFALNAHLRKVLSLIGEKPTTVGFASARGGGERGGGERGGGPAAADVPFQTQTAGAATDATGAAGAAGAGGAGAAFAGAGGAAIAAASAGAASAGAPAVPAMTVATPLAARSLSDQVCAAFIGEAGSTLFEASRCLYLATASGVQTFGEELIASQLVQLLTSDAILVGHDIKALLQELLPPNSARPALITPEALDPSRLFDCQVAAYLLDSSQSYSQAEDLLTAFLPGALPAKEQGDEPPSKNASKNASKGTSKNAFEDSLEGGGCVAGVQMAQGLFDLYPLLFDRLAADGSLECFQGIEMPLVPVLVIMERWGVNVDLQALQAINTELTTAIEDLRAQALREAGEDFNLDSPRQLGAILFEKLKLPAMKKTRSGYSTDAKVLTELKAMHPLPGIMLEYRELAKLKSTYLDALPRLIASDGHIHTSFNQTVAATGRLSSSDPNLQNIPVRTDLGRRIRTAFVPDARLLALDAAAPSASSSATPAPASSSATASPATASPASPAPASAVREAVFLSADYSQIELRLLAHLSGDAGLIEAFREGEDFHAETAARVFGLPLDQVTPQLRSRAKAVNFGIVYGQQAFGLAQSLGVGFVEAQEMIRRYFTTFPRVSAYLDEVVEQARISGWAITLFGRKRHIHELHSSNANLRAFGERTAKNHPMQGSAADIIKLAMIEIQRRLRAEGFVSQMVLQVHDELDFNCALEEVERLSIMVREVMEGIVELRVPLIAEVSTGSTWAEAH
jgi:DNA polymerase-1